MLKLKTSIIQHTTRSTNQYVFTVDRIYGIWRKPNCFLFVLHVVLQKPFPEDIMAKQRHNSAVNSNGMKNRLIIHVFPHVSENERKLVTTAEMSGLKNMTQTAKGGHN